MDAEELLQEACVSGVACLSSEQLLVITAQALATDAGMNAEELLEAACESGIACLPYDKLLVVIAQALSDGSGPPPPPAEECCSSGIGSPEGVVIGNPGKTYLDTSTDDFWVKETGVGTDTGWIQLIIS